MRENEIIRRIEEDLRLQYAHSQDQSPGELDKKWKFLTESVPRQFINDDLTLKKDVLRDFRKWTIFIADMPIYNKSFSWLKKLLSGAQRGGELRLKEMFATLKEMGLLELLAKYPANDVGHPNVFTYKGYQFTERWVRHIMFLALYRDVIHPRAGGQEVILDIGSSYGIFSYLVKKEFSETTHVLLDFPEQLVLAYYYLGMSFPQARIAGYKELVNAPRLDHDFFKQYDFVLLPWTMYKKMERSSVDVVANFASLGEMRREWFDYYMNNEPFLSAKIFFCVNRFQSAPTYDTDLTILDYPLCDFKRLHFCVSPYFSHTYRRKALFFYERLYFSSQYFEFIGKRSGDNIPQVNRASGTSSQEVSHHESR